MNTALGYILGFLTQSILYMVVFGFLVKEGISESYYYWTISLGSIAIGFTTKVAFGMEGAIGNIIALIAAVVFMGWKYASVDALWLVSVFFFILLHAIEAAIWYSTLKQRSIKTE